MGHTNSTANLALPQFIGTDKPTWLSDVNGAFAAIDAYAGTNDAALAITDAKADTAVNDAASAVTTATNAANTAGTASTQATNAVTVAGNALTVANGINSKVGVLTDLNTTDKSSVVNAINEVNGKVAQYTVVATSAANQTFADQLTELEAAYDALSTTEKLHTALYLPTAGSIYKMANVINKVFSSTSVISAGIRSSSASVSAHTWYSYDGSTVSDISATTNTGAVELIIM